MSCQCNKSCQHWVETNKRHSLYTLFFFLAEEEEEAVKVNGKQFAQVLKPFAVAVCSNWQQQQQQQVLSKTKED